MLVLQAPGLDEQMLTIASRSQHTLVFKVKTTNPKRYCVRPNNATLQPGASVDIKIVLQKIPAAESDAAVNSVKSDKFLIEFAYQDAPAMAGVEVSDLFNWFDKLEARSGMVVSQLY